MAFVARKSRNKALAEAEMRSVVIVNYRIVSRLQPMNINDINLTRTCQELHSAHALRGFCGERRIHAKTAQKETRILARETPHVCAGSVERSIEHVVLSATSC